MCLLSLAWGADAQYPLVLAANRDEFYERPTAPLHLWRTDAGHSIVSGRDLRDGGTWIGFSPTGRFACLTNVRQPDQALQTSAITTSERIAPELRSRGALPVNWLTSLLSPRDWAHDVDPLAYAGFNLLVGDWQTRECLYISNRGKNMPKNATGYAQAAMHSIANNESGRTEFQALITQPMPWGSTVGLSNAALDTPWPKTQQLKQVMATSLRGQLTVQSLTHNLQLALCDTTLAPLSLLPDTGIDQERERAFSSVFVRYPYAEPMYGTRSSLVAVLDTQNVLHMQETTYPTQSQSSLQDCEHTFYSLAW